MEMEGGDEKRLDVKRVWESKGREGEWEGSRLNAK
jgi:hypothetical protein